MKKMLVIVFVFIFCMAGLIISCSKKSQPEQVEPVKALGETASCAEDKPSCQGGSGKPFRIKPRIMPIQFNRIAVDQVNNQPNTNPAAAKPEEKKAPEQSPVQKPVKDADKKPEPKKELPKEVKK